MNEATTILTRTEAKAVTGSYRQIPLSDLRYRSKAYERLLTDQERLQQRLKGAAWDAFRKSYTAETDFFSAYPGAPTPAELFDTNSEQLRSELASAGPENVQALVRRYSTHLPPRERFLAELRLVREDNRHATAKQAQWELSSAQRSRDLALASFADLDAGLYLLADGLQQIDLPGAAFAGSELTSSQIQSLEKPYAAIVVQGPVNIDRRVLGRSTVQGQYVHAEYQVPNPEFAAAQANFISAQSNLNSTRFQNSLNPQSSVFGAVLAGLAEGASAAQVTAARNALAAIPATITQRSFASYQYEIATVESVKTIPYELVVVDISARKAKRLQKSLVLRKTFQIPNGRRPDDTIRMESSYATDRELSEWEAAKGVLALDVADTLREVATAAELQLSALSVAASSKPSSNLAAAALPAGHQSYLRDDPRFISVVVVQGAGLGSGFFVDDYLIVTNYHVVEGASVVEIKMRDGTRGVGQVVKTDLTADLALVRVTQKGVPVQLSLDPISPRESVDAIGHPKGLEFTLTRGIVSAVRTFPGKYGEMHVIQTDTPINPGNSGGPLYRGGSVIGINTVKRRESESLGFAVHASEIRRLMAAR